MERLQEKLYDLRKEIRIIEDDFLEILALFQSSTFYDSNLKRDWKNGKVERLVASNISSSEFSSSILRKAHELNPVKIEIGFIKSFNEYDFINGVIILGVSFSTAINFIDGRKDPSLSFAKFLEKNNKISNSEMEYFKQKYNNFFDNKIEIRAVITHEIVHWLQDTFERTGFFNKRDSKNKKVIKELKDLNLELEILKSESSYEVKKNRAFLKKLDRLKKRNKHLSVGTFGFNFLLDFEIDAQVNELNVLKTELGSEKWNTLDFKDFAKYLDIFSYIEWKLEDNQKAYDYWYKQIIKRLVREGFTPLKLEKRKYIEESYLRNEWESRARKHWRELFE